MSPETAQTLSAQEQAIVDGKKVLHGTATDRVLRILDTIRSSGPPRVALERAVYFTESFKATEGQPLVWRWAKALKHIAENMDTTGEEVLHQVFTWLAKRGVTVAVSRVNPSVTALLRHYHLLELIGENRLYPTNRHAVAAFRRETGQATPETL